MEATTETGAVLRFTVSGSKGDEYTVIFAARDSEVASSCSCMAGRMGHFCRHRLALLDGDVSDLVSDNAGDVVTLRALVEGTALGLAYQDAARQIGGQAAAYKALGAANRDSATRRPLVRVLADVSGTGIKAGMVGSVIETQAPGSRNASFTTLADTAYLVRFAKEPLKKWAETQSAPPAHLPIGAELWLRETEVEPLDG